MQIISRLVGVFINWLNAPSTVSDSLPDPTDWADLPTYHPSRD